MTWTIKKPKSFKAELYWVVPQVNSKSLAGHLAFLYKTGETGILQKLGIQKARKQGQETPWSQPTVNIRKTGLHMSFFPLQRFQIQPNTPFTSKNFQQAVWEKWLSFLFNLSWGSIIIHSFTAFNKAEPSGTLSQTPKDCFNLCLQNQIPSCLSLSPEFYVLAHMVTVLRINAMSWTKISKSKS